MSCEADSLPPKKRRKIGLSAILSPTSVGVVELCGFAGAGKTQLLIDLCCREGVATPGRVVFVDTEGSFSAGRAAEILQASVGSAAAALRILERLLIYRSFSAAQLLATLQSLIEDLRSGHATRPFRCVFVDSVAFPLRSTLPADKATWFTKSVGRALRRLSEEGTDVLVTNHLLDSVDGAVPCLGAEWSRYVGKRIVVERAARVSERIARVQQVCGRGSKLDAGDAVVFRISAAGVQGEDEVSDDEAAEEDRLSSVCSSDSEDVATSDLDGGLDGAETQQPSQASLVNTQAPASQAGHAAAVAAAAVQSQTAGELLRQQTSATAAVLLQGVPLLGALFKSRPWTGLLEVCGEAATGKTQLCLHCSAAALRQCLETPEGISQQRVVYYYSHSPPLARCQSLVRSLSAQWLRGARHNNADPAALETAILDSVLMQKVSSLQELLHQLRVQLPTVCQVADLRLLVVDSIAGLCRAGNDDLAARAAGLMQVAAVLHEAAGKFQVPVIVVNEVLGDVDAEDGAAAHCVKPALGSTWSSCMTHRLSLQRSDRSTMRSAAGTLPALSANLVARPFSTQRDGGAGSAGPRRLARIEFSAATAEAACPFGIGASGIVSV
eukprot:TRINITY_DN33093_c0_g1_i1.p1 TRINITY_DN33093_c0_g1~~TRINITY_DN33093_c0_g1_i1.p1  ORF type:complete len:611 (+),score=106.78 TRINITY_DN33093_c0_g1_i1:176-2008(+)